MNSQLDQKIAKATELQLSQQSQDGYWWYTLEANEAIGAEYMQMTRFLGAVDPDIEAGLIRRILSEQRADGAWSLYYGDEGDLHITIECYFVLKMAGHSIDAEYMKRAREFIHAKGGLTKSRVFTRIHLAMFGLLPWNTCPIMPINLMLLKDWMPVNIYEFSSWARACIVPLLVIMNKKPVRKLSKDFTLDELFVEPANERNFQFTHERSFLSWENFFIQFDKWLKLLEKVPFKPIKGHTALKACEKWITDHIERTEDIYPAMAYAAVAMNLLDRPLTDPTITKCLSGLKSFQQRYEGDLPAVSLNAVIASGSEAIPRASSGDCRVGLWPPRNDKPIVHQQCCISPVWDTPWSLTALLDSGTPANNAALLKAGKWLISKQITADVGDWKIKNPHGRSGGWSFEFQNDYFPDIDDTIQVLHVLKRLDISEDEKGECINKGIAWIMSMQNDDGGWAAFDKNNDLELVNKIPFSDHGACLDPSSPDITARVIKTLTEFGFTRDDDAIKKGIDYIYKNQTHFGGWFGRWGINYIYGTWTVLTALKAVGENMSHPAVKLAVDWLTSIQRADGGWSESPETYKKREYIPCPDSVPSQTAWAVMGLMAVVGHKAETVKKGVNYLLQKQLDDGSWDEPYFTGTGFPGHFYIRYHGYRHYFPLMALGLYKQNS